MVQCCEIKVLRIPCNGVHNLQKYTFVKMVLKFPVSAAIERLNLRGNTTTVRCCEMSVLQGPQGVGEGLSSLKSLLR